MRCPNCNKEVEDVSEKCNACGFSMEKYRRLVAFCKPERNRRKEMVLVFDGEDEDDENKE